MPRAKGNPTCVKSSLATTEQVDFLEDAGDTPTITDLMRALSGVEQSVWAEKTLGYEVRK